MDTSKIKSNVKNLYSISRDKMITGAPDTVIFAPGGTRRQATLLGIKPDTRKYAVWGGESLIRCLEILFKFGVKNVFVGIIRFPNLIEVSYQRDHLVEWIHQGL